MLSWNILGILIWVIVILYLVFVIQNIRRRRITMIIKEHKRFSWPNFLLDVLEIIVFLVAAGWMFNESFLDNPNLDDHARISSTVSYDPLIMSTGTGNSSYVTINSSKKKVGSQSYTFYKAGNKMTVSSNNGAVAFGKSPIAVNAEKIPYDKKDLQKKDREYQRAYVATYTARYKRNWQNGIGMHAGKLATQYYLIRIPDASFIKQK